MTWVKSSTDYETFTAGRGVTDALHREDDSAGDCIAWVESVRSGDSEIDEAEYLRLSQEIRDYNDTIPETPAPVSASAQRRSRLAVLMDNHAAWTADDQKAAFDEIIAEVWRES